MDAAVLGALYSTALAFRLLPLLSSTLPLSVDGFSLLRISSQVLSSGHWQIDPTSPNAYNEAMPGFSMVWAFVAAIAGANLILSVQTWLPFVTATSVFPGYLLARKVSGNRIVAGAAGLFLAVFGSFLSLTSGVAKESLALLMFPMAVLLYAERADPRKRGLSVVLFIVLPTIHHLTTLLALGAASALVVLDVHRRVVRGRFSGRALALDLVTGPALALTAYAYYVLVGLSLVDLLLAPAAMALFLSVAVVLAVLLAPSWRAARLRRGETILRPANRILLVPVLSFVLLLVDARTGLFAGTVGILPGLLPVALASVGLVAFAYVGWQLLRRTANSGNDVLLAFLVAPTAMVIFGLLRGLDPASFVIVYRSVDFLDYALAVLIGLGLAYSANRLGGSRTARIGLGAGVVTLLLVTTSMATDSQQTFGVSNVTTPSEFQALSYLASLHPRSVATDERLGDVASWWFGLDVNQSLPLAILGNASLSAYDYAVVEDSWSTIGAQVHPAPNVVISPSTLGRFASAQRVVYVSGLPGDRVFVIRLSAS